MAKTQFVAKAIVLESTGKFLLLTRSDTHPTLAGFYDLPGGTIEPGEEPGRAVTREVLEETGLSIASYDVMYATTMLIGDTSYPTLLYRATLEASNPAITLSWEHSAYEWADLEKLQLVEPQLAPTYRQALEYIRANDILKDI